jgi:hypothetical protein
LNVLKLLALPLGLSPAIEAERWINLSDKTLFFRGLNCAMPHQIKLDSGKNLLSYHFKTPVFFIDRNQTTDDGKNGSMSSVRCRLQ